MHRKQLLRGSAQLEAGARFGGLTGLALERQRASGERKVALAGAHGRNDAQLHGHRRAAGDEVTLPARLRERGSVLRRGDRELRRRARRQALSRLAKAVEVEGFAPVLVVVVEVVLVLELVGLESLAELSLLTAVQEEAPAGECVPAGHGVASAGAAGRICVFRRRSCSSPIRSRRRRCRPGRAGVAGADGGHVAARGSGQARFAAVGECVFARARRGSVLRRRRPSTSRASRTRRIRPRVSSCARRSVPPGTAVGVKAPFGA